LDPNNAHQYQIELGFSRKPNRIGLWFFKELIRVGGFNNERRGVSRKGFLGRFREQLIQRDLG